MRFVQPLLTDDQAELIAAALRDAEETLKDERAGPESAETLPEQVDDNERLSKDILEVGRLLLLFQDISENPSKYTPTGTNAATVRGIGRRVKGQPQTPSRRRKRSGRHARRRALRHKMRRDREYTENYNAAIKRYGIEQAEHEANVAEINERVKDQPKFTITDGFGNVILDRIPAEFIKGEGGVSLFEQKQKARLYVPMPPERVDL